MLVACSCGKKLSISEQFAGKKICCPICNGIVAVPQQNTTAVGLTGGETLALPPQALKAEQRQAAPTEPAEASEQPSDMGKPSFFRRFALVLGVLVGGAVLAGILLVFHYLNPEDVPVTPQTQAPPAPPTPPAPKMNEPVFTEQEKAVAAELEKIVSAYLDTARNSGHAPANLTELRQGMGAEGDRVQFDRYLIIWNANLKNPGMAGMTAIAMERKVPDQGGLVSFTDGKTRKLTADNFKMMSKMLGINSAMLKPAGDPGTVSVSAVQLTREFSEDAGAARKKLSGKSLEVEGVVVEVQMPKEGTSAVVLQGFDEKADRPVRVHAAFPVALQPEFAEMRKGQTIQIRGKGVTYEELPGNPGQFAVRLTAERLVKK